MKLFEEGLNDTLILVDPNNGSWIVVDDPVWTLSTIGFGVAALCLICVTLVGNVLVVSAVLGVRKLRQPSHYLLISLAMADFCVALFVMPLSALYQIRSYWTFGYAACILWTTLDVLLCSASILNLCAVSVDRYWAITRPLTYAPKRTTRRMICYTVMVWIMATAISVVPNIAFKYPRVVGFCEVNPTLGYQLYATISSFYIPVFIIVIVNCEIFAAASKIHKAQGVPRKHAFLGPEAQDAFLSKSFSGETGRRSQRKIRFSSLSWRRSLQNGAMKLNLSRSGSGKLKESKAAKTLTVITGAFIICWLPFFVIALLKPICGEQCDVPAWLEVLTLWLGYGNSGLNPFLYAAFNRDFRVPFRELLCCRCRSLRKTLRMERYAEICGDLSWSSGVRRVAQQQPDVGRDSLEGQSSLTARTPLSQRPVP